MNEQQPTHTGVFEEDSRPAVQIEYTEHAVRIGYLPKSSSRYLSLSPKQALSLLAWLEQERETLEQMAQEPTDA